MQLFTNSDIHSEFRARWSRSERDLSSLDQAELAQGNRVDEIKKRESRADVPVLDRAAASFPLQTEGKETSVQVVVPFTGGVSWFYVMAPGMGYGSIHADLRSGPHWGEGERPSDAIIFRRKYSSPPDAAEIRSWAAGQVDAVEACLQLLRPLVATQVAALEQKIDDYAAARLASLTAKQSLEDGLGTGI